MFQEIFEKHEQDKDGNPAGGRTTAIGIDIHWQDGPLGPIDGDRKAPNGAFVEGVLAAALGRMQYYQNTKFVCRENAIAITKIEEALHWLGHRTADRMNRGVEGTHNA